MFNYLSDESNKSNIKAQDKETQERLIEALLLVMYADGEIKLSETRELEELLDTVDWDEKLIYRGKYGEIIHRVREAMEDDEALSKLIEGIRQLEEQKKNFVLDACKKMAQADGMTDPDESSIIDRMR